MKTWEYRLARYKLADSIKEEVPGPVFYCDQKGQCILHDASQEMIDLIQSIFNEEGQKGWELVQLGYHLGEIFCIWKREITK